MPHLLNVQSLSYRYGDRVAVDDIEFHIDSGEAFGLLGPNGAGKTTTISCLAGLRTPSTGQLTMNGAPFAPAETGADRARIGVVPQELAIYDKLTAEENLALFAGLLGLAKAEVASAVERQLEFAGLADRRKDRVETFSGGMKRRLNLAVGLIHEPALVLLDEPTVGVDPQSRSHLFESLIRLKEQGTSILYTTHYMEEADRLCDRVAIMCDGKIAATGTRQQLASAAGNDSADLETIFLQLTGRSLRDE